MYAFAHLLDIVHYTSEFQLEEKRKFHEINTPVTMYFAKTKRSDIQGNYHFHQSLTDSAGCPLSVTLATT